MASINLPFPMLKSTGDDKRDIEVYIEDLNDYCMMNNWYDSTKKSHEEKWTKPEQDAYHRRKHELRIRTSTALIAREINMRELKQNSQHFS